jgi:hypothetical protein
MTSGIDKYFIQKIVMNVTASVGLTCSLLCVILMTSVYIKFPQHVNRMPIRLIFFISLADVLNCASGIFFFDLKEYPNNVMTIAIFQQLSKHLYMFTNISVCYLLQSVVLFGRGANFYQELVLIIISVVLSIISVLVLYFMNMIGQVSGDDYDLIAPNINNAQYALWIVDGIIQAFCIFICLLTVVLIHLRLYIKMRGMFNYFNQETDHDIELKKRIKNIVKTTILFPIAPVIILPLGFVQLIMTNYLNMTVDRSFDTARIGVRNLSGVFTLIALLCDFNFRMGLKRLILTLLKRGDGKPWK